MSQLNQKNQTFSKPAFFSALIGLLFFVFYWSWILIFHLTDRALNRADNLVYAQNAAQSAQFLLSGSWNQWMGSFMQDNAAKPITNALISLFFFLFKGGLSTYYLGMSCLIILFFLISTMVLKRHFGAAAALFYSVFLLSSNLILEYSLDAGHNWAGQFFLWVSFLFVPFTGGWKWFRTFFIGFFISMSLMASIHLLPFALWFLICSIFYQWKSFNGKNSVSTRTFYSPLIFLFLGLLTLPFILAALTRSIAQKSYLQILMYQINNSSSSAKSFFSDPYYFFNFLTKGESSYFLLICSIGFLFWCASILKRVKEVKVKFLEIAFASIFLVFLLFMEFSGALKLGRIYLPALPFFFATSAIGIGELIHKIGSLKLKICIVSFLLVSTTIFGFIRQKETKNAFFAGKFIRPFLTQNGISPSDLIVVGVHYPYSYLGGEEKFIPYLRSGLKGEIKTGEELVFLSYFSTWLWQDFLEEENKLGIIKPDDVVPVKKIFNSREPYQEVDGVENIDFQIFSNEAIYDLVIKKRNFNLTKNRLYKAKDILKYL
ncbi:MAG: hypothetical protein HYT97_01170 [Elusimicrobia bacterium]|nr:hypothetical protein [Elusimicrobiota bacterium]